MAAAPQGSPLLAEIVTAEARIDAIAFRLTTANVPRCPRRVATLGARFHSAAIYDPAYRATASTMFGFGDRVGVETIVPSGPAARADIHIGDVLLSVDKPGSADLARLDTVRDFVERLAPQKPVLIDFRRGESSLSLSVTPIAACRSRFELLLGKRFVADADGETVRIGAGFLTFPDGQLAAVMAHEFAHNILRHRARSAELRIASGLAGEFGRSARLTLAMEDEADRLSLHLLADAGYDPRDAATLWRENGATISGWLPRGSSHRSWSSRAAILQRDADDVMAGNAKAN